MGISQGSDGVTVSVQEKGECITEGYGLVGVVVLGWWLG